MSNDRERDGQAIFEDLKALTHSIGSLHNIVSLVRRDWFLTVDVKTAKVVDTPEERWSPVKLNTNELMLLLGLAVQSPSSQTFDHLPLDRSFEEKADKLLREFHDHLLSKTKKYFDRDNFDVDNSVEAIANAAREAIYYGADSFYVSQLKRFARHKYRNDDTWLLQNIGLSIRPMIEIADYIGLHVNQHMTYANHYYPEKLESNPGELTNCFAVFKEALYAKFGKTKTDAFLDRFATPATNSNSEFNNPFAVNQVSLSPLIDIGEAVLVLSQHRLMESVYESPFYWMIGDKNYKDSHVKHRGDFLERSSATLLKSVFGEDHVHQNVEIKLSKKEIATEADTLVVYGDFVLIVQAKSKRLTLKAKAGDPDALAQDFRDAIQSPYKQALKFKDALLDGGKCVTVDGNDVPVPDTPLIFPVVLLCDPFPAITFLSQKLLKQESDLPPVIWDIAVLDCMSKILPLAVDFLFYLKCRANVFQRVQSDSEYNLLGYHLGHKLYVPPDINSMLIDRGFATVIDDYMIAQDLKLKSERPTGILERFDVPIIAELFSHLRNTDPKLVPVVIELYNMSGKSLCDMAAQIEGLRSEVRAGKALKAFSLPTESGGISYVVVNELSKRALESAEALGLKHKYDCKMDRWYVLVDCISTSETLDALLPITHAWHENDNMAEFSARVGQAFKSQKMSFSKSSED